MSLPTLSLIAALDRRRAIGLGNALPWHLPDDLKRFKALTLGQPVLMGRKTAQSLGRALPGRENYVLSRSGAVPYAGMERVESVEHALRCASSAGASTLWVIGGGDVYAQCLARAQRMHLTHVDTELPAADTWFPAWDREQWSETARESHAADARHAFAFEFIDYVRR